MAIWFSQICIMCILCALALNSSLLLMLWRSIGINDTRLNQKHAQMLYIECRAIYGNQWIGFLILKMPKFMHFTWFIFNEFSKCATRNSSSEFYQQCCYCYCCCFRALFFYNHYYYYFSLATFSLFRCRCLLCFVINCVSRTHKFTGADFVRLCRMTEQHLLYMLSYIETNRLYAAEG